MKTKGVKNNVALTDDPDSSEGGGRRREFEIKKKHKEEGEKREIEQGLPHRPLTKKIKRREENKPQK